MVLAIVMVYKWIHVEVIHDVTWGMSVSQVKQREDKYDGNSGYYDEENGYYAVFRCRLFGRKRNANVYF